MQRLLSLPSEFNCYMPGIFYSFEHCSGGTQKNSQPTCAHLNAHWCDFAQQSAAFYCRRVWISISAMSRRYGEEWWCGGVIGGGPDATVRVHIWICIAACRWWQMRTSPHHHDEMNSASRPSVFFLLFISLYCSLSFSLFIYFAVFRTLSSTSTAYQPTHTAHKHIFLCLHVSSFFHWLSCMFCCQHQHSLSDCF